MVQLSLAAAWNTKPFLHYALVYTISMLFFLVAKLLALPSILDMFAAKNERTAGFAIPGILLGMLQDFLATTLLVVMLLVLECLSMMVAKCVQVVLLKNNRSLPQILDFSGHMVRFTVVLALILLTLAPVAVDLLLIQSRAMRFTTDLLVTYSREKDHVAALEIDAHEITLAMETVVPLLLVSLVFAVVYVRWIDLTKPWKTTTTSAPGYRFTKLTMATSTAADLELAEPETTTTASEPMDEPMDEPSPSSTCGVEDDDSLVPTGKRSPPTAETKPVAHRRLLGLLLSAVTALALYVLLFVATCSIANGASPLIAAIALNATLNELYRNLFHLQFQATAPTAAKWAAVSYLQPDTEQFELFAPDVLYRRTTGFTGPLTFDVHVNQTDLPNVLIIGVESFRYLDSLYLAMDTTAGAVMQKHNLTMTPNFDRWAKKGIAFNNLWSSWQTSRSLEAILFGQVNYDSVTDTGTTTGRPHTKVSGLPQFFKQKQYETIFTTGCTVKYDQWDTFLLGHGFDQVLGEPEFKKIAHRDYNITKAQWTSSHRGFQWGVHDDLSFAILGDLMLHKTKQQKRRVQQLGQPKKPFFLNHYTISSHMPFESYPDWFAKMENPDFSPLCEGQHHCELIKKYATLRYFTDMELGKFMDRMEAQGVLNDTIVWIVGDHGQSPEYGISTPYMRQTECQHVAATMVAQGRLGEYAGLVVSDATQQYDLLNTMLDIIGLPEGGFSQTGVGRSLKREIPFGQRLVWSNNPMKKMSVVRGHERFVYDRTSNEVGLFDTIKDPLEKNDLLPSRTKDEVSKWDKIRTAGRTLSSYFTKRWDGKCLTQVDCH